MLRFLPLLCLLILACTQTEAPTETAQASAPVAPMTLARDTLARTNIINLQSLVQTYPEHDLANFYYAEALRRRGRFAEALTHYDRTLAVDLLNSEARLARAFTLIRLARYERAKTALEDDLKLFPQQLAFKHLLTRVLAASPQDEVRDPARAAALIQELIGAGTDVDLIETAAMVWAALGRFEQAREAQQQAIRILDEGGQDTAFQRRNLTLYVAEQLAEAPWPDNASIFTDASFVYRPDAATATFKSWQADGLTMKARLKLAYDDADLTANLYENDRRADRFRQERDAAGDVNAFLAAQTQLALELLRAGRSEEAIQAFERLKQTLEEGGASLSGDKEYWLLHHLALAHLRLGEQQNCLENHTSASCLLPIQAEGVHTLPLGSRNAIRYLTETLQKFPDDLLSRWLLNLAHQTLGQYPSEVSNQFRIDPLKFESKVEFPRFKDMATPMKLDTDGLAGASVVDDFDNDGLLDVFTTDWSLSGEPRLLRNRGDGVFEDVTEAAGLKGLWGGINAVQTDYDNDGYLDLYILRGGWLDVAGHLPNSLLRNRGDMTFDDVTEASGLLSFHPSHSAVWLDVDLDGHLDLFVANEDVTGEHPSELFRNRGDGTFEEIGAQLGLDVRAFIKGVTTGDVDNDGDMDLYLSCLDRENLLLLNGGRDAGWVYRESPNAGVGEPFASFPTWLFDFDNDGHLDLYVSDYHAGLDAAPAQLMGVAEPDRHQHLYRNRGDGSFEDVTEAMGLDQIMVGMGGNFGDLDNDGFQDFYVGTGQPNMALLIPNRMFRNAAGTRFDDVTYAGGFGHLQKGHGVSFADLDNDGDQDVHITMGGAYTGDNYRNALFLNPGFGHDWLTLKLEGTSVNRAAIGARVTVRLSDGRQFHRQVSSGGSFGASPLRMELGLGENAKIERIDIRWPGGEVQQLGGLAVNRAYHIRENEAAQPLAMPSFEVQAEQSGRHAH